MKVRTDKKRDEILEIASKAFLEFGFERTSMAEIAARVGGSKATLYGYFRSKEELFIAVTHSAGREHVGKAMAEVVAAPPADVEGALRVFGEKLLAFMFSPTALAAQRMVIARAGQSDIGRVFYESGPAQGHAVITKLLSAAMESGHLKRADPGVAASHFMALTIAENQHRLYFRDLPPLSRAQIRQTISRAIAAFMSGHAEATRS